MFDQSGGSCPHTVQLAPGQDIRPASVVCQVDGAGASGSFLLCLGIYSQDGTLISRTAPPVTFAVGDTGVVTFAPFLGKESSAPPAVPLVVPFVGTVFSGGFNMNRVEAVSQSPGQDVYNVSTPTASNVFNPIASPDGLLVLYEEANRLVVANADGSGGETTIQTGDLNCHDWLSATLIVFNDQTAGEEHKLKTVNSDGTGTATLYTDPSTRQLGQPLANFDRSKVAFAVNLGAGTIGLWTMNSDGTNAQQAATFPGATTASDAQLFAWARGANWLVYKSGGGDYVRISYDGSGSVTLGASPGTPLRGCVTPDDAFVYYPDNGFNSVWRKFASDGSGSTAVFDESATSVYGALCLVEETRFYLSGQSTIGGPLHGVVASYLLDGTSRRQEAAEAGFSYSMF